MTRITKAEATTIERAGSDPLHGEEMRVRLTFTDEILGTASAKKDLHETYIASKAPDAKTREQEIAAIGVEEAIRNAMTIFPRNEKGEPMLWPYQVRGFFKAAQGMMNMCVDKADRKTSKAYMPSYKSKIDNLVFVKACDAETYGDHRGIVIHVPEDKAMDTCERPLRAETMQGPRVSLANSESCPAGSYIEFDIMARGKLIGRVMDWLDFGRYNGLGQWRNSGKGAFEWEVLD